MTFFLNLGIRKIFIMRTGKNSLLVWITVAIFFLAHFAYFRFLNSYHLVYQEQTQLFLYNQEYFSSFMVKPGGLSSYLGAFLIQFYRNSTAAALIVTLLSIALFSVSKSILNHFGIKGILWSFIPVIMLAALQSNQLYLTGTTIGLLISSLFFLIYVSAENHKFRYLLGFAGCTVLYFIAGSFLFLAAALCVIHELAFSDNPRRFMISPGYILICILIPVISSKLIYYINPQETWLSLMPFQLKRSMFHFLYALLLYFPLLLIIIRIWKATSFAGLLPGWNWKNILAGIIVLISLSFILIKYAYDKKTDILLRIDHHVMNGEWDKALEYSFRYPGTNQIVLYYGNMAMYKTGQMGDRMFHLPQAGIDGLLLEWRRNEIAPFFGGEVFYQLGYISEAYRWAFEAMVATGQNPRSLKRLVLTSLIQDEAPVAQHYINILNETLFYRKWAQHYQKYLNIPGLILKDKEIMDKRYFLMHTDIFASTTGRDAGLLQLLKDHPDNRMSFEYYMASLLLNKDLDRFVMELYRLKELGYSNIPVHYEEAMLAYMDQTKKNIVPSGYSISSETLIRLSAFINTFNSSGSDRNLAARSLYKDFGGTYWFYLNFANIGNR